VTHDIGAAVEIADRVAVMYAGRIVEEASIEEILYRPRHPYTQVLLGSRPKAGLKKGDALHCIPGSPPDLSRLPPGCAFAERCPHAPRLHAEPADHRTGRAASRGELPPLA
jgi:peptide/nickel transport system ATP-binding protein